MYAGLLPFFYSVIWKYIWKLFYLKADLVGVSIPSLTKDFTVVTFKIRCLWCRYLRECLVSTLHIIDIAFFPAESESQLNFFIQSRFATGGKRVKLLLAKVCFMSSFKYHSFTYSFNWDSGITSCESMRV